jgi:hypothetical protein
MRWEDKIKIDVGESLRMETGKTGSRYCPAVGFDINYVESSDFVNGEWFC